LKVLARTGLPQAQIAALQPHHLDLEAREITVTPRHKGRGVAARTLPITHKAVRAFKEFQREKAFGTFSRHSMWRMFQQAVEAAKASWKGRWPAAERLRPYDLRHAFATELYKRTRDLRATAELLLHADMTMTARYAEAAVSHTAQAARDAMDSATRSATNGRHNPPDHARIARLGSRKKRGTSGKNPQKKAGFQSGARGRS
jgi:site-specific recombinase XerC